MKKSSTTPCWSAVFASTVLLGACADDIGTIPPSYDSGSDAGGAASNGGSSGRSAGGTTASTGGTSTSGSGGTGALSTGGTGGSSGGGITASSGGTLGGGGGEVGASAGTGVATMGGETGAGTGPGGRAAAGFGSGGRTGIAGRGGATAGGAGGASAGSTSGEAGSGASTFAAVGALVQMTCATADCHGGKERPSLLNTNPTTLYNTLMNTAVRQCGSDHLVTANDPANSALLELVQHQCGMFVMPEDCSANPCIDADAMATITAWIQAGAPAP